MPTTLPERRAPSPAKDDAFKFLASMAFMLIFAALLSIFVVGSSANSRDAFTQGYSP